MKRDYLGTCRVLERDFRTLHSHLMGEPVPTAKLNSALQRIQKQYHKIAVRLLHLWWVKNPAIEADEIVQEWMVAFFDRGWQRLQPGRPIQPFAYRILRRCCIAAMKRSGRSRELPSGFDLASDKSDWLDAGRQTEELCELRRAIAGLPLFQRRAVMRWLRLKKAGRRDTISGKAAKRYSNFLFRARKSLKAALLTEEKAPNTSMKISRFCK